MSVTVRAGWPTAWPTGSGFVISPAAGRRPGPYHGDGFAHVSLDMSVQPSCSYRLGGGHPDPHRAWRAVSPGVVGHRGQRDRFPKFVSGWRIPKPVRPPRVVGPRPDAALGPDGRNAPSVSSTGATLGATAVSTVRSSSRCPGFVDGLQAVHQRPVLDRNGAPGRVESRI